MIKQRYQAQAFIYECELIKKVIEKNDINSYTMSGLMDELDARLKDSAGPDWLVYLWDNGTITVVITTSTISEAEVVAMIEHEIQVCDFEDYL
ncbi:Hypothetical protein KNT65_gp169 [Escherichia phage EcS1]|uniref:Uncharacterized protein n=1 Tax=Escherichia phage EcS1 TaxID=2083276 RepID=A0A2Z5ZCW0_9CAUD|nr:Hypothetical protein KNT65_gp169 [Escherichia phage EcS1]BBC78324.1 Hypothetical protein [Escherichia phage EcS1]